MSELTEIIRREIATQSVISFARFMELALYCPRLGYYERQSKQIGCQGDFYTSVTVGSLFGELLAFQFTKWVADLARGETIQEPLPAANHEINSNAPERTPARRYQLVEAGAHDGQLAFDILKWIERLEPAWRTRFEYWILEPSSQRQHWQREKLAGFAPYVRWFDSWQSIAARALQGVIFSNELLDAFPVHRIAWDAKTGHWFEWGVGWDADHFVWKRMPIEAGESAKGENPVSSPQLPQELLAVLPDGFTTEISPAANRWWQQAARALGRGQLMTLDYGLNSYDFFVPERASGTLRAYLGHHCSGDLFARPGDQDLTANVNITALQRAGEAEGLMTESVVTQAQFLTRILECAEAQGTEFGFSRPECRRQFQTLTHPDHLGRPLKVLVQSRP